MASVCVAFEESSSVGTVTTRDALADETTDDLQLSETAEIVRTNLSQHLLESDTMYSCQDMLTCGNCHLEFALSDIVKFINHKVISCSKGNCRPSSRDIDENEDGIVDTLDADASIDDEKDENIDPVTQSCSSVRKQTPSIITSSHRHKLKFLQGKGQHVNNSRNVQVDAMRACDPTLVRSSGKSPSTACTFSTPGVKQTVDAHTNTINTGKVCH
ncbi:hypothetical protein B4U80_05471 [Leptotrombidium deliense]|uniref:BCL-11A-like CCHC zinc finger domain-containing protein n=1 Tax=Leptotrombidium deliense TaxID=299467 RepID=A0A443SWM8_9ACAR|nr:hypothetical protein B4U80_05471 [Leptotrombidium deliense]